MRVYRKNSRPSQPYNVITRVRQLTLLLRPDSIPKATQLNIARIERSVSHRTVITPILVKHTVDNAFMINFCPSEVSSVSLTSYLYHAKNLLIKPEFSLLCPIPILQVNKALEQNHDTLTESHDTSLPSYT